MTLLRTEGLRRTFGGLAAVDGVDFTLEPGEVRALIGPNGAGKTTFVGLICGRIPPTAGRIAFEGVDITPLRPWERVARGIAYTFQITSVFSGLSCYDNVALAAQRALGRGGWGPVGGHELDRAVSAVLQRVGLADQGRTIASALPYGHQRLLELALGLALRPKLLILDEPTQGLSEGEIARFCALVRDIAGETTILLIEHNMPVVMELARRITVMNNGKVLAEGSPGEIKRNRAVQEAYLGT